ncbi:hypothetical protein BGW39_000836 [Mortierella sp. 14UC]|nr:hypothetical protein BGW39_000836 [Mortierella sp. 14UC]
MKYIASLALLATAIFSSSANASLDLCSSNHRLFDYEKNSFFFPNNICNSGNEICLDVHGTFKTDIPPANSEVIFHARKGDISEEWRVGVYSSLKVPAAPIGKNYRGFIRVCTYLPPKFGETKNTDIDISVKITRPGENNPDIVICLDGSLHLN